MKTAFLLCAVFGALLGGFVPINNAGAQTLNESISGSQFIPGSSAFSGEIGGTIWLTEVTTAGCTSDVITFRTGVVEPGHPRNIGDAVTMISDFETGTNPVADVANALICLPVPTAADIAKGLVFAETTTNRGIFTYTPTATQPGFGMAPAGTAATFTIDSGFSSDDTCTCDVPEPSTLALFGIGTVGLFGYYCRRLKRPGGTP